MPQAFQILDSADQLSVVKRVMKSMNLDDEKYPPRQVQWFIANQKEHGLRASQVDPADEFERRLVQVYEMYDQQCQREGVVDFAELLLRAHELLSRNEILREHYRARFRHILVDEFQDTNKLQYAWLRLLAGRDNLVFAVGDDDQSVYRFRAAPSPATCSTSSVTSPRRRSSSSNRTTGRTETSSTLRTRSSRTTARVSARTCGRPRGSGEPLRVYEAASDGDEARYIVEEVRRPARRGCGA